MSDINTNTNINIETITTSDNIKQFMDKCNRNFTSIAENGGGPRGAAGQDGAPGATGKRGNKFHYVPIIPDVPFGPEEATAALSNVDDIEYGDFVFFFVQGEEECAYAAFVDFEETSEGFVPVITSGTLISLQGPKGEQGVPGDAASDQFDVDADDPNDKYLILRDSYHRIVLPKPTQALSSVPSSTLCIVKGGIGFVSGDREKSAINGSNDNGEFTISSELNMSLASKENITIGEYANGVVSKNINITGNNINIIRNGSANGISLDQNQNNVRIYGKSKFDNDIDVTGKISSTGIISSTQKITSPSIETNNLKITGLNTLGFVQINSNDGFNVGNVFKINPTNKKISITSNVDSTQPIRAKVGNDVMELGVPKYTFMLYPKSATTPSGWCEFSNDLIIPIISEENYGTQSSYQSGNQLWFKYKVSTTTDGITTSTMKYVKINLSEIYQVTFDRTRMSSVTTISSSTSGSESAESYTFEPISKNGVNYVSENTQSQSSSSMSSSYNVPNFIDNDMSVVDYDIVVDDIGELPWEQVVIPNNILNNYQQLIKHMLTNKGSLQNMSGIFTRMNILVPIGQNYNRNTFYTLSVPDKASMFKWIFKVS